MASKHQFTGMTGLYLVAAELAKREFVVSPTSRSALTADLLVTDATCRNIYAVQVKTNSAPNRTFWLVGPGTSKLVSKHYVYALVNLREAGPEIYFVPSKVVARKVRVTPEGRKTIFYSVLRKDVAKYRDKWGIFKNERMKLKETTDKQIAAEP